MWTSADELTHQDEAAFGRWNRADLDALTHRANHRRRCNPDCPMCEIALFYVTQGKRCKADGDRKRRQAV